MIDRPVSHLMKPSPPARPTTAPASSREVLANREAFVNEGSHSEHRSSEPYYEDEIDLRELFLLLWSKKWIIMLVTVIFAAASVLYALSLNNYYRANALLAPAVEQSGGAMAALSGQFGGLASLAGINLPGGGDDKVGLALEVMKSRQFAFAVIESADMKLPLIAAEAWNRADGTLVFDGSIYNAAQKKWVRKARADRPAEPTLQEAYERYLEVFSFTQDKKTGLVTVAAEFYSPTLAASWTELIVDRINEVMKAKDLAHAKKSIRYLEQQIGQTAVADMQNVFYQLIEEQSKTMMLAETREEYVFTTIDPAVVPERKAGPKRSLICILGTMVGGMLAVFGVLLWSFFASPANER